MDFTDNLDLASLRLGGAVVSATDDYFAEKENLLKPGDAVWLAHEYTDRGKWMDGWESRRKRVPGHDWAVIRLGVPGIVRGVLVDTAYFRGNYPSHCSIEACAAPLDARPEELDDPSTEWVEILAKSPLNGDSKNRFEITSPFAFSHVRLRIYPDGGVARFRVYGEAVPDWRRIGHARGDFDVAAAEHGGQVLACSDMFFGERRNLIMPDRALNMSDGWETRRRRGPGHDWSIVKLAGRATLSRLVIDTNHFKGNYPDTCTLEACDYAGDDLDALTRDDALWKPLLDRTKLQAHTRHYFEEALHAVGPVTHLRLCVYPDGGVSRLRVYGSLDREARLTLGVKRLDTFPPGMAAAALKACCGSTAWVEGMLARRPFKTPAAVLAAADAVWSTAGDDDVLEAFRAHPRIGEQKAAPTQSAQAAGWSRQEQSGVSTASDETRAALAEVNRAYEARFGFVYIVCATGRSADEMLQFARSRMGNERDAELRVAAGEQAKITRIRLEKLLEP